MPAKAATPNRSAGSYVDYTVRAAIREHLSIRHNAVARDVRLRALHDVLKAVCAKACDGDNNTFEIEWYIRWNSPLSPLLRPTNLISHPHDVL